jgi:hypothetical protein
MIGESHGNVMVPDGIYEGICTGITVKFTRDNQGYQFELLKPTSEENTPVKIVVTAMKGNVYKV